MLLGPRGWEEGVLYLRADVAPSAQVELLLRRTRVAYPYRWDVEAEEQVSGKFSGKFDGGYRVFELAESRKGSNQGRAIVG